MVAGPSVENPWQIGELAGAQPNGSGGFRDSVLASCLVVLCAVGVVWMSLLLLAMSIAFLTSPDALSGCLAVLQPSWLVGTLVCSMFPGVILGTWLNGRRRLPRRTLQDIQQRKEELQREIAGRRAVRTAAAVQERFKHEQS